MDRLAKWVVMYKGRDGAVQKYEVSEIDLGSRKCSLNIRHAMTRNCGVTMQDKPRGKAAEYMDESARTGVAGRWGGRKTRNWFEVRDSESARPTQDAQ